MKRIFMFFFLSMCLHAMKKEDDSKKGIVPQLQMEAVHANQDAKQPEQAAHQLNDNTTCSSSCSYFWKSFYWYVCACQGGCCCD